MVDSSHDSASTSPSATPAVAERPRGESPAWAPHSARGEPGAPPPSIAEIARIAGIDDPVMRNLRITQCYHALSSGMRDLIGPAANWCSFACWTSRQAGNTIRRPDLIELFHDRCDQSERVRQARARLVKIWTRRCLGASAENTESALRELLTPTAALAAAGRAVAAWNFEVFSEIGLAFGRFLGTFRGARELRQADIDRFCRFLQEEPEHDLLSRAFRSYHQALFESSHKLREEWTLLGNLLLCMHEHTLLQPHIDAALAIPAPSSAELEQLLLDRLRGGDGLYERAFRWTLLRTSRFSACVSELAAATTEVTRALIADQLLTLQLGGESMRMGIDLERGIPPELVRISLGDLDLLLRDIDADFEADAPDTKRDCTALPGRLRFLSGLLRRYQDAEGLLRAPFSPEQCEALRRGELPKPPLG